MTHPQADDWSNYWQGRTAEDTGAALAGAGIEDMPVLNALWQDVFSGRAADTRVLDLACGAGSALRHAEAAGLTALTGADISSGALDVLKRRLPGAETAQCSAEDTPFADQSFDIVASQFGFEYAGYVCAAREAARLVAPGGKFIAVSHYQGGAIEQEVTERLGQAQAILDTGFVGWAGKITVEVMRNDKVCPKSRRGFEASQEKLSAALADDPTGLARHLAQGFQQLFQRRNSYLPEDITGWLQQMQGEIEAFIGRMQSMKNAALSVEDVEQIGAIMTTAGLVSRDPHPVVLREGSDPGAWVLQAERPV